MSAKTSDSHRLINAAFIAVAIIALGFIACEQKPAQPPTQIVTPTPPPPPPVVPVPVTPVQPAAVQRSFRVYEDKKKPEQFVELVEFTTACEGIGDIFANDELILNPKVKGEQKFPLSRLVAVEFDKFGLVDPTIKGVGAVTQPAGYRGGKIILKNPDETLEGIIVICRELKGKKADGAEWSANLKFDTATAFYKIEIIEAPK